MEQNISQDRFPERRTKPRINCDYPAIFQGNDGKGGKFSEKVRVVNISTSGVFIVARSLIENDTEVFVKIKLPTGSLVWGISRLATKGNVIRSEQQPDGTIGIAIRFHNYKFL
jgi:hypothetical protein